jgi:hypothetical protein
MSANIIATGDQWNLTSLDSYESSFSPGDGGILHIDTVIPVSQDVGNFLYQQLVNYEVPMWGRKVALNENGNGVDIYFFKHAGVGVQGIGLGPLALLAVIVAAAIAAGILILVIVAAWKLSQIPASEFTPIITALTALPWILGVGAVLLGGVLIFRVFKQPRM